MTFSPNGFPGETDETAAGDMARVAYFAPPHPGEEACRVVRVGLGLVFAAMGFLVVDPGQREAGAVRFPAGRFVGAEGGVRGSPPAERVRRVDRVAEYA
ncbi:MAG TPA: hypothetical protein VG651_24505 [Stellaceae bacterium]|nr:hypothetical protein [Stellaceae bacterium]